MPLLFTIFPSDLSYRMKQDEIKALELFDGLRKERRSKRSKKGWKTRNKNKIMKVEKTQIAFEPRITNHGNVFGTGSWYTFYCGNCGCQLNGRVETCEGTNFFVKGCGSPVKWI